MTLIGWTILASKRHFTADLRKAGLKDLQVVFGRCLWMSIRIQILCKKVSILNSFGCQMHLSVLLGMMTNPSTGSEAQRLSCFESLYRGSNDFFRNCQPRNLDIWWTITDRHRT